MPHGFDSHMDIGLADHPFAIAVQRGFADHAAAHMIVACGLCNFPYFISTTMSGRRPKWHSVGSTQKVTVMRTEVRKTKKGMRHKAIPIPNEGSSSLPLPPESSSAAAELSEEPENNIFIADVVDYMADLRARKRRKTKAPGSVSSAYDSGRR